MTAPRFVRDDGGRAAAGYRGTAGDCVVRAIAIAGRIPYLDAYGLVRAFSRLERTHGRARSSPRDGVRKATWKQVMEAAGGLWVPTMLIGAGCTMRVRAGEIPASGRVVLKLSHHACAVIDGVIHDNHDPARDGARCVYGYWRFE